MATSPGGAAHLRSGKGRTRTPGWPFPCTRGASVKTPLRRGTYWARQQREPRYSCSCSRVDSCCDSHIARWLLDCSSPRRGPRDTPPSPSARHRRACPRKASINPDAFACAACPTQPRQERRTVSPSTSPRDHPSTSLRKRRLARRAFSAAIRRRPGQNRTPRNVTPSEHRNTRLLAG